MVICYRHNYVLIWSPWHYVYTYLFILYVIMLFLNNVKIKLFHCHIYTETRYKIQSRKMPSTCPWYAWSTTSWMVRWRSIKSYNKLAADIRERVTEFPVILVQNHESHIVLFKFHNDGGIDSCLFLSTYIQEYAC